MAERSGVYHDSGKIGSEWQARLAQVAKKKGPVGIDHWSAGMLILAQAGGDANSILALSVAYHHGGLGDLPVLRTNRIDKALLDPRIVRDMHAATALLAPYHPLTPLTVPPVFLDEDTRCLAIRMLHSCLVDADCLDTEAHFNTDKSHARRGPDVTLDGLWAAFELDQNRFQANATGPLDKARKAMYDEALSHAQEPPGFFSLPAPTGMGKTRTAMGFALQHALAHGKDRVIVAIPYTSVVEQTVKVYRDIFGKDPVLEHHCHRSRGDDDSDELEQWQRITAQNWDAPVVVTTHVQFLESLFTGRNRRLRKLHNVANSVIVLDEIQTLPPKLIRITLRGLNTLVDHFGCTVVFSTATQPPYRVQDLPPRLAAQGLKQITPLLHAPAPIPRAKVAYLGQIGAQWLAHEVEKTTSSLTILNTIGAAFDLADRLDPRMNPILLTSRLCGVHRSQVLTEIHRRLDLGLPCTVIATQCAETGVDIDFPTVYRALGPYERLLQAVGRCNRHGKLTSGDFRIFDLIEGRFPSEEYKTATLHTRTLLEKVPDPSDIDLDDPRVFRAYYHGFIDTVTGARDPLLEAENRMCLENVGRMYRLIEDGQVSVLVPWPGAVGVIRAVKAKALKGELKFADLQEVQAFMVSIYLDKATAKWSREVGPQGLLREWVGDYHPVRGLEW